MVHKFATCYKQAYSRKKSGSSEDDIMEDALAIYAHDTSSRFMLVSAWKLLKNEPKWSCQITEESNMRTKNYASGAYTSSSNPDTPTSGDPGQYNSSESTWFVRLGQKQQKERENQRQMKHLLFMRI